MAKSERRTDRIFVAIVVAILIAASVALHPARPVVTLAVAVGANVLLMAWAIYRIAPRLRKPGIMRWGTALIIALVISELAFAVYFTVCLSRQPG